MGVTRRGALALLGAGALGAVGSLAACSGPLAGFSVGNPRPAADDELLVALWGTAGERAAFADLAASFTAATGVRVRLQTVPFSRIRTVVDTGLRSGSAPDVFRVTYNDVGFYRGAGVLATLPDAEALRPAFGPAFWAAVSDPAGAFAVPHHTDTTMVLVDTAAAAAAGVGPLPATPAEADAQGWDWARFTDVARRLAARAAPGRYAFAVNWQDEGAYRWCNWVDQAGGRLLAPSLDAATAPDDPGLRSALDLTRGFFRERLVPSSTSTSGTVTTDELFSAGTVAMAFVGNFSLGDLDGAPPYTAVPLPRGPVRASGDLGGNALAATDGPRREQALAFLRHCVEPAAMAGFCAAASALPTRVDVPGSAIGYRTDRASIERYVAAAGEVREALVEQVVVPRAAAVNAELRDSLERAFLDPAADTGALAADLVGAVDRAVRR